MDLTTNKKDIVKEAIAHREVFPVPYCAFFEPSVANKLMKHFGTEDLTRSPGEHIFYTATVPALPQDLANDVYTDVFGVGWEGVGRREVSLRDIRLRNPVFRVTVFQSRALVGLWRG